MKPSSELNININMDSDLAMLKIDKAKKAIDNLIKAFDDLKEYKIKNFLL